MSVQDLISSDPKFTEDQAAEFLGVKSQTLSVWRSAKRYNLPYLKIGRNVRYRLSDLTRHLRLLDAAVRLEAMDRDGVDVQIMCVTPLLFGYHRPAAQALEYVRIFNDAARELCAHAPRRLKSLCQVPLQDTDLACREVSRRWPTDTSACRSATTSAPVSSTTRASSPSCSTARRRVPRCLCTPGT